MKKTINDNVISIILLLSINVFTLSVNCAEQNPSKFSDISTHWSKGGIETATSTGWVTGYPDGTFKPEGNITRAEFVKMLDAAIHLTPDSETSRWLVEQDQDPKKEISAPGFSTEEGSPETIYDAIGNMPDDLKNHWLTLQGWSQPALAFGMIDMSDYREGGFEPDRAITRTEIAVMTVRAIGRVYNAKNDETNLTFTDKDSMGEWMKGFVQQATDARIITGYPDGSFGGGRLATRAEAVTMVERVLKYMEAGIDKGINTYIKTYLQIGYVGPDKAKFSVPIQVINGLYYVPLRSVLYTFNDMYSEYLDYFTNDNIKFYWSNRNQALQFNWGPERYILRAGLDNYPDRMDGRITRTLPDGIRILYGEIMVPLSDSEYSYDFPNIEYDSESKKLVFYVSRASSRSS